MVSGVTKSENFTEYCGKRSDRHRGDSEERKGNFNLGCERKEKKLANECCRIKILHQQVLI